MCQLVSEDGIAACSCGGCEGIISSWRLIGTLADDMADMS